MRTLLLTTIILLIADSCFSATATKVIDNGSDTNKIVIAVFSEGYTHEELGKFSNDVNRIFINGLFGIEPFRELQTNFNEFKRSAGDAALFNLSHYQRLARQRMARRPFGIAPRPRADKLKAAQTGLSQVKMNLRRKWLTNTASTLIHRLYTQVLNSTSQLS